MLTPATKRFSKPPMRAVIHHAAEAAVLIVLVVENLEDRVVEMAIHIESADLHERAGSEPGCGAIGHAEGIEIALVVAIDVVVSEVGWGPRPATTNAPSGLVSAWFFVTVPGIFWRTWLALK